MVWKAKQPSSGSGHRTEKALLVAVQEAGVAPMGGNCKETAF